MISFFAVVPERGGALAVLPELRFVSAGMIFFLLVSVCLDVTLQGGQGCNQLKFDNKASQTEGKHGEDIAYPKSLADMTTATSGKITILGGMLLISLHQNTLSFHGSVQSYCFHT